MKYKSLNFQIWHGMPDLFKKKFKRELKVWTIESVHDLYVRALNRHNERHRLLLDCIDRIANQVPSTNKNERVVYYTSKGKIYSRTFFWRIDSGMVPSWSVGSPNQVVNEKAISAKVRDNKLEFILSNEIAFELGEEYQKMRVLTKYVHLFIFAVLEDLVQEKLRSHYEGVVAPNITVIDICGKKYNVYCDDNSRYCLEFKTFKILGEAPEEVINL